MRSATVLGTNLAVGGGALGWLLYRSGAPALALLARHVEATALAAFAAIVALVFLTYAARWRLLLAGLGALPALARLVALRAAGQSVAALVPSAKLGGDPLRALLLARDEVPGATAIATVAADRTLEIAAGAPFACVFAALLLRHGVPGVEGAFVTVSLGALAIALGLGIAVGRLRRGAGLVTALVRSVHLDRWPVFRGQIELVAASEAAATRLLADGRRLGRAFALGIGANVLVLLEYRFLLVAFDLPHDPLAVVAAIFASGAAHSLPVPAAVGVLEGAETWLFTMLGYAPEVGLAVGLAMRLRELVWAVPGLVYLAVRGLIPGSRSADVRSDPAPANIL